jgi:hypothetical protein
MSCPPVNRMKAPPRLLSPRHGPGWTSAGPSSGAAAAWLDRAERRLFAGDIRVRRPITARRTTQLVCGRPEATTLLVQRRPDDSRQPPNDLAELGDLEGPGRSTLQPGMTRIPSPRVGRVCAFRIDAAEPRRSPFQDARRDAFGLDQSQVPSVCTPRSPTAPAGHGRSGTGVGIAALLRDRTDTRRDRRAT